MSCRTDYDDSPVFFTEVWRRARVEHSCCECLGTIQPGEDYQTISGKWNGDIFSFKTCAACVDLRDSLDGVTCVPIGDLWFAYLDYLGGIDAIETNNDGFIVKPLNHMTRGINESVRGHKRGE